MRKKYRKIIVNDEEYDWLYIKTYDYTKLITFKIVYEFNQKLKRKRRFLSNYNIKDYCDPTINFRDIIITPNIVKKFINYKVGTGGTIHPTYLITKKDIRRQKLNKINELDT